MARLALLFLLNVSVISLHIHGGRSHEMGVVYGNEDLDFVVMQQRSPALKVREAILDCSILIH